MFLGSVKFNGDTMWYKASWSSWMWKHICCGGRRGVSTSSFIQTVMMFCGDDWLVCSTRSHNAVWFLCFWFSWWEKKTDYKTSCIYMLNFSMVDVSPFYFLFLTGYIIRSYFNAFFGLFLRVGLVFCIKLSVSWYQAFLKLLKFSKSSFFHMFCFLFCPLIWQLKYHVRFRTKP